MCSIHRVNSNHSLYPSIPKFADHICSVHQDSRHQKVASIWAYMYSILRVHSNHLLCPSIPKITNLICSVHQDRSHQKVASIWAYMGGLALMVISSKIWELSPFFMFILGIIQPHLKSFSDFNWIKASHNMQKYDRKIFAFTQQSNSNFLAFWVDNFFKS